MNILLINTYDYGGAARAAYSLHKNFKSYGHNSKMLVKHKTIDDEDILQFPPASILKRTYFKARESIISPKTDRNYYFYNVSENKNRINAELLKRQMPFKPDFIIAAWISNFINSRNLYELNKFTGAPIAWYLMDMAAMTGGCHYAWNCDGYKNQCGCCPALYSTKPRDISYRNLQQKRLYLEKTDLTVVTGTEWLTKQAKESSLFTGKKIAKIMLGIDNDIFKPADKYMARSMLKLPLDRIFLFFGTIVINEKRKGGKYLLEALRILSDILPADLKEKVILTTAGRDDGSIMSDVPFPHNSLGMINDDLLLALAYQSADVFICPSIEDSGPMMINEAIICGTPVVSFDMGVAPDLVHTGKTGYRAKLEDSEDLAKGIAQILSLTKDDYDTMSDNCKELGLRLCHPKVQVQDFEKLFAQSSVER